MTENRESYSQVKISIVLPVYNVEKYLEQCLDSVLNQDLKEIEVICVNDGSSDNSGEILDRYQKKDSRVIVINQENQGQGAARNSGMKIARGEYLFFVDPDDWIMENSLKRVYDFAKENNSTVVFFDSKFYNEPLNKFDNDRIQDYLTKKFNKNFDNIKSFSLKDCNNDFSAFCLAVWNRIFKTDFIKNNNISFPKTKLSEDTTFSIETMFLCDCVHYFQEYVYCYRIRKGSTSHTNNIHAMKVFDSLDMLEDFMKEHNLFNTYKKQFYEYKVNLIASHFQYIPSSYQNEFIQNAKKAFSPAYYSKFMRAVKDEKTFLEKIFSVRNSSFHAVKFKEITVFGLSFRLKTKSSGERKFKIDIKPQIMPKYSDNKNAFVFAINNSHTKYFGVALKSLIENSSKDKTYDVIVFADDIELKNKERLEALLPPNFSLRYYDISEYIKTSFYKIKLKTNEGWPYLIFYRCFIPFVMQYYDKVLYLDSDTLINKNPDSIFDIDLQDKQLGVCVDIMSVLKEDLKDNHTKFIKEDLKIENHDDYFNSGVILFDIKKIDINDYFEKFINAADRKKYMCPDQDCLNVIFLGKTKNLPLEYNYQFAGCVYNDSLKERLLPKYKKAVIDSIDDPLIIHFLEKPWKSSKWRWGKLHDKFWEYAKKTPFYEEILFSSFSKIYESEFKNRGKKLSLLEKIFSVRNEYINEDKYKVITFFGKKKNIFVGNMNNNPSVF